MGAGVMMLAATVVSLIVVVMLTALAIRPIHDRLLQLSSASDIRRPCGQF